MVAVAESSLIIPPSFIEYCPTLAAALSKLYQDSILAYEIQAYGNGMPRVLANRAEEAVMLWIANGDNFDLADRDLARFRALTKDHGFGPRVKQMGIAIPFVDQRQDKGSSVSIPAKLGGGLAINGGESITTLELAEAMSHLAFAILLDPHSFAALEQLKAYNVETIAVTAVFEMLEELGKVGLFDPNNDVICGLDLGNLSLVKAILLKYPQLELAAIHKRRISKDGGSGTSLESNLVYGDVKGKRVILTDDMISSAGTLVKTADLLDKAGAKEIVICVAHPVLAKGYAQGLAKLFEYEKVKFVMMTNSIPFERPDGNIKLEQKGEEIIINPRGERQVVSTNRLAIYDVHPLIKSVVAAALEGGKNIAQIEAALKDKIYILEDKYKVFNDLTEEKIDPPKFRAFCSNGKFYDIDNPERELQPVA